MSDNNKFSLDVGYVQLHIIKHALEAYITREASDRDKAKEKKLLNEVNQKIDSIKFEYRIGGKDYVM